MSLIRRFLRRRTLLAAFAAFLAPLFVLLGLQYIWLDRLSTMTAIAHQAALNNFLEAVGTEVEFYYRSSAERALNLPSSIFNTGDFEKAAWIWKKKPVEGARRLFLVDFTGNTFGNFHVYNPESGMMESPLASDESLAMIVACIPWQLISGGGGIEESVVLRVDERNPEHRFILNPITDERSRLQGLAGMILDERHFKTKLLPEVIRKTSRSYFPEDPAEDLVVTVRDGDGRRIFATGEVTNEEMPASRRFSFVFSDWTAELHSMGETPEQWARASFISNLTLAALVTVVMLGGVTLTLRAANRAVALSEMKADFVSNVSHELRTPLASIRVFAELLKLGKAVSAEKTMEYGEYIEAESRRLSRLINNILDFSRIESGLKSYQFVRASLDEVVASSLETFKVRTRASGFHVTFEGPASPLPDLEIDADAVGQALYNLLDNAVKYSGPSREIGVRLSREHGAAVIAVRDKGIGIARSEQKKIFDRFHRVGTGLVHDVKGSGLGLSIVHHIVRAHGGRVEVESQPGEGSTFIIKLPIHERPARAAHGEESGAPERG